MMDSTERAIAIEEMKVVSDGFYARAFRIGNHPFIEFCGLMNEYINSCRVAHDAGIDFSECSAHSGQALPIDGFALNYINEKLNCIFSGRVELKEPAGHA